MSGRHSHIPDSDNNNPHLKSFLKDSRAVTDMLGGDGNHRRGSCVTAVLLPMDVEL